MEAAPPDALLAQLCEELPDLAEVGESAGSFMFDPAAQRSFADPAMSAGGMQNNNVNLHTSLSPGLPAAGGPLPPMASMVGLSAIPMPMMPPMPPPSVTFGAAAMTSAGGGVSWSTASMFDPLPPAASEEEDDDARPAPLRVKCPYCGGRAINLGGAARRVKYVYACEDPACQQRWNQRRNPDENGDFDITPSKRAIGNEARRSGGYACGKCGAKPKWGHKCPYKYSAASDASGNGAGSALPPLPPLPSLPPLSAVAPTVDAAPTVGAADAGEESEGEADAAVIVQPPLPSVSAQTTALASAPDTAPVDDEEDAEEEDDDPAAFLDDDDDDEASAEIAENSPSPKKEEASSEAEVDAEVDAAMDDDEFPLSGHDVHSLLSLTRHRVKGDGSCWVYAVLACLGLLEHDHPKLTYDPTPRDRGMDALCRIFANAWFTTHMSSLELSETERAEIGATNETVPEYPCVDAEDMGSFGNMTTIMCIAGFLGLNVVCWNKKTLRNKQARQQCVEFAPTDADPQACKERMLSSNEIVSFCAEKESVIHIEWDGLNHYAALLSPAPVEIPEQLSIALLTVDPVTRQLLPKPPSKLAKKRKPDASETLPAGWSVCTDKIRLDAAKCKVVKMKKTTQQHLSDAIKGGFNAVFFLTVQGETAVKYLGFDFNLTSADCADAVGFTTQLYIHSAGGKRRKTLAPIDSRASCFCCKFYRQAQSEIQCTACGRWCHTQCAFPECGPEIVAASEASYMCPGCSSA
jgi:hypothetical protein